MPKKFQLDVTDDYRWVETDQPFGQLQFTDIAGDEYYGATKTYRIALIGRGSAVAYYLTAVAPRQTGKDESEAIALHKSMVIFGRVDPWSTAVRGDGYINHEDHLVGHWGTTVARYSAEYLRRDAFVRQNAAAFARAEHLGAELADEDVIMVLKRGELYQIYTKGNRSYFAAFVVAAMGLGPHRGLNTGPGTPQLPKGQRPRESQEINVRRLAADWKQVWNHPVVLAETFVDTSRYRGTCYRAANWLHLGETAGRSKRGNQYLLGATKKSLFVYPLHRHARRLLVDPPSTNGALQGS